MTLGTLGGLAFSVGDGIADPAMTFTGTLANVNAALASASYRGNQDYNGPDTLVVAIDDQGNSGSGGPLADTKNVAITVTPQNNGQSSACRPRKQPPRTRTS